MLDAHGSYYGVLTYDFVEPKLKQLDFMFTLVAAFHQCVVCFIHPDYIWTTSEIHQFGHLQGCELFIVLSEGKFYNTVRRQRMQARGISFIPNSTVLGTVSVDEEEVNDDDAESDQWMIDPRTETCE